MNLFLPIAIKALNYQSILFITYTSNTATNKIIENIIIGF